MPSLRFLPSEGRPKTFALYKRITSIGRNSANDVVVDDASLAAFHAQVIFDGKDHPAKGSPDWDANVAKRVDSHTIEFTRKKGGKAVQTATSVVSKDGKTRTVSTTGVNAQGQKISSVAVYEKK